LAGVLHESHCSADHRCDCWLAGRKDRARRRFRLIGNIVVGIIGALVASFLLPALGVSLGIGWVRDIVNATIGAVVVLVILSLVRRA
jgi:uncharacterized membrane protein YeaQ/YmgE (transglycosylase-associated protein family)